MNIYSDRFLIWAKCILSNVHEKAGVPVVGALVLGMYGMTNKLCIKFLLHHAKLHFVCPTYTRNDHGKI